MPSSIASLDPGAGPSGASEQSPIEPSVGFGSHSGSGSASSGPSSIESYSGGTPPQGSRSGSERSSRSSEPMGSTVKAIVRVVTAPTWLVAVIVTV
jgi:hypothetical protein